MNSQDIFNYLQGLDFDPSSSLIGSNLFSNGIQGSFRSSDPPRPGASKPIYSLAPTVQEENKVKKRLQKTKVCKHFLKCRCHYGTECTFAHYSGELQVRPNLHKTKMCAKAGCADSECPYAHDVNELRLSETPRPDVDEIDDKNSRTVQEQKALLDIHAAMKGLGCKQTVTTPLAPLPFRPPSLTTPQATKVGSLQQENERLRKALDLNREALIQLIASNKEPKMNCSQSPTSCVTNNVMVDTPTNPMLDIQLSQAQENTALSLSTTQAGLKDEAVYALLAAALNSVPANSDAL